MKWLYSILTLFVLTQLFHLKTSASLPIDLSNHKITAHRGSSYLSPENTLEAIKQAYAEQADIVEIDVRLTKDNIVVLSHDDNLKRTAGVDQYISQSRYDQLKNINVAFYKGTGYETIPTLESVLQFVKRTEGKLKLNIELKSESDSPILVEKVVNLILDMDMQDDCYITSFNLPMLEQVKQHTEVIQTGLIIGKKAKLTPEVYANPAIDILSLRASIINHSVMKSAREQNMLVFAWTVNEQDQMRKLLRYNIDSIITDRPAVLDQLLEANA